MVFLYVYALHSIPPSDMLQTQSNHAVHSSQRDEIIDTFAGMQL